MKPVAALKLKENTTCRQKNRYIIVSYGHLVLILAEHRLLFSVHLSNQGFISSIIDADFLIRVVIQANQVIEKQIK